MALPSTTIVGTFTELKQWDGSGTLLLSGNITVTAADLVGYTPITLQDGAVVDGNRQTINFDGNGTAITGFTGLFNIDDNNSVEIKKLLLYHTGSVSYANNCGALITDCYGGTWKSGFTINVSDVGALGTYTIPEGGGGLIGRTTISAHTTNLTNCYSLGNVTNSYSGGLVKYMYNGTIQNCFTTGIVTGLYTGGLVSEVRGNTDIYDCYTTGNVDSTGNVPAYPYGCGAVCVIVGNSTLTIRNFYHSGNLSSNQSAWVAGLVGDITNGSTLDIDNIAVRYATKIIPDTSETENTARIIGKLGLTGTLETNSNLLAYNSLTAPTTYANAMADSNVLTSNTNVWIDDDIDYGYRLTNFTTGTWVVDTNYNNNYDPVFFGAAALGDPHVIPFIGHKYDLELRGSVRYFDNCYKKDRLIINAFSDIGDGRDKSMDYFRKVVIFRNNNYLMLDLGFRGEKVKIIDNKGFDVKETELKLNKSVRRKCEICEYSTWNNKDMSHNNEEHLVKPAVRNQLVIEFSIEGDNDYLIAFENVNQENSNPCGVYLNIKNKGKISNYFGPVIKNVSDQSIYQIPDILDKKLISYGNETNNKIAPLFK